MAYQLTQYHSAHVPGKKQNCATFGTYVTAMSPERSRTLCHGGWLDGVHYDVCPVREQCRDHTREVADRLRDEENARLRGRMSTRDEEDEDDEEDEEDEEEEEDEDPRVSRGFAFRAPQLQLNTFPGRLPSALKGKVPRPFATGSRVLQSAPGTPGLRAKPLGAKKPPAEEEVDELPGMDTPYLKNGASGASPTFLPNKGRSTFERLLLNIVQGVIAMIGYQIWNFLRSVDLFA